MINNLKNVMNDRVEILMATYNGGKYISEQIESILGQTYKNWKLLIHDDGSSDNTVKIVKKYADKYPNKILFIDDGIKCGGAKENFSHLLSIAKSEFDFEYIMFADQDDVWLPQKIELSIKKIKEMEKIHGKNLPLLVYTDLKVVDSSLNLISESFWKCQCMDPSHNSLSRLLMQNVVVGCTVLINRTTLLLGTPIPKEAILHDWWLALVASGLGYLDFLKTPTVLYRRHERNDTGVKRWNISEFFNRALTPQKFSMFKQSMQRRISQAEKYLELYSSYLNLPQKESLQAFVKLLNSPRVLRLYYVLKYNFFKTGFLKNLGTMSLLLLV